MKKNTTWLIGLFFGICFASTLSAQKDFYDVNTIQEVRITFEQKNWRYMLDSLRYNGEALLKGRVEINGQRFDGAGVRYRDGKSFTPGGRRNGLFVVLNHSNDSHNYQGYTDVDLSSALRDPSMVREVLGYEIARHYAPAPKANFAKVSINGEYYGLFVNVESVTDAFLTNHFGTSQGSLFKSNPNSIEQAPDGCKSKSYASLQYDKDPACFKFHFEGSDNADWRELVELTRVLNESPEEIDRVLDVDRALWMLAFNNLVVNLSSYLGQYSPHYYLYNDGKGRFVPIIFDLNLAFGSFKNTGVGSDLSNIELMELPSLLHADDVTKPLISVLLSNELHRKQYFSHMRTMMGEYFASGLFEQRARELQRLISDALSKDSNRYYPLDDFNRSLLETIGTRSNIPGIVDFMQKRLAYLEQDELLKVVPPAISDVKVIHRERFASQQVTDFKIQAKVEKFAKNVRVFYRFESSQDFAETTMHDDGKHNDEQANDGIYGVVIQPAPGSSRIEYYIMAENARAVNYAPLRYTYDRYSTTLAEINQ